MAGLSMGGYGAIRWALREPGRFAAAASLSGGLDLAGRLQSNLLGPRLADLVFGGQSVAGTDDDLFALVGRSDPATLPMLYVGCGTEDFLYEDNVRFVGSCTDHGINPTVHFGPGEHEWGYWDAEIQNVLAWLPL